MRTTTTRVTSTLRHGVLLAYPLYTTSLALQHSTWPYLEATASGFLTLLSVSLCLAYSPLRVSPNLHPVFAALTFSPNG
jgi:hypothetical protein